MERMKSLTGQGQTLLIVSHLSNQILQFSDRVIWLDKGRIVASGDPLHIVNMYEEFSQKLLKERWPRAETTHDVANVSDIPRWILQKQFGTDKIPGADWAEPGRCEFKSFMQLISSTTSTVISRSERHFPWSRRSQVVRRVVLIALAFSVMYDEAGNTIMRSVEPECQYDIRSGETIVVKAKYDLNPIGAGVYFVSGGLFRDYVFANRFNSHRIHILSRALTLRIHSATDDCRIATPVKWQRHKFSFDGAVAHGSR